MLSSLKKIEIEDFEKLEEVIAPIWFSYFRSNTVVTIKNTVQNSQGTTINNVFNFYFNF